MSKEILPLWYERALETNVSGFVRLITNPNGKGSYESIYDETHPLVDVVRYLTSVSRGDGSRAYCPFVASIERKNMYYAKTYDDTCSDVLFHSVLAELRYVFCQLSSTPTSFQQKPDLLSIVAGFSNDTEPITSHALMSRIHQESKLSFMELGLMVAYMHPLHPLGGRPGKSSEKPLFVSKTPLYIVRRMNREDHVFMKTDLEKKIYQSFI